MYFSHEHETHQADDFICDGLRLAMLSSHYTTYFSNRAIGSTQFVQRPTEVRRERAPARIETAKMLPFHSAPPGHRPREAYAQAVKAFRGGISKAFFVSYPLMRQPARSTTTPRQSTEARARGQSQREVREAPGIERCGHETPHAARGNPMVKSAKQSTTEGINRRENRP